MSVSQETGWGRTNFALSQSAHPQSIAQLAELVSSHSNSRGALANGLRRRYGDSSLNSGGLSIGLENIAAINISPDTRIATVGAGASIRSLEHKARELNLFPPVVPGTGFVTIGGAIAADIHGKSHHATGTFSACVERIQLLLASGELVNIFPTGPSAPQFWATVGGLGLTGIITEADIRLRSIASPFVQVEETREPDLAHLLSALKSADAEFEHTVAWIDLSGDFCGRGIVGKGNYETREYQARNKESGGVGFPSIGKYSLINSATVRAFNELWFRKPLASGKKSLNAFMHPLDGVQNWNRMYGNSGFFQYQFVVPDGNEDFIENVLGVMKDAGVASFLGVLKRFGQESLAYLSFPKPGWTLAIDVPHGVANLEAIFNSLDEELCRREGRVYLIKDARIRPEHIPVMYPQLEQWRKVRKEMDPNNMWQSDQSRRLKLC